MFDKNTRSDRRRHNSRTAQDIKKNRKPIDRVTVFGFIVLIVILGAIFGVYTLIEAGKNVKIQENKQILAGALPEGVIATVGDLKIDTSAFAIMYFNAKSKTESDKKLTDPAAISTYWKTGMEGTERSMEVLKKGTLDFARQYILYLNEVNKAGVKLSDQDKLNFEKTFNSTLAQQFGAGIDYKAAINSIFHVTLENYKKYEQSSYLISKYQTDKLKTLAATVTDKQALDYYNINKTALFSKKYVVQHILFKTIDATNTPLPKAGIDNAKKMADEILVRVKAGENMDNLALKYSQDTPGVKDNKGIYEVTQTSQFDAVFKAWALAHKQGDTGIIKTQFGYHVMKQLVSGLQPFESAKKGIVNTLAQQNLNTDLQKVFTAAPVVKIDDNAYLRVANIVVIQ